MEIAKYSKEDYLTTIYYINKKKSSDELTQKLLALGIQIRKINILRLCELKRFDVIHSHCFLPDVITAIYILINTLIFKRKQNTISTVHSDYYYDMKDKYGRLSIPICSIWTFSLKKFKNRVFLTEYLLDKYIGILGSSSKIWNGLDIIPSELDCEIEKKIDTFSNGRRIAGAYGVLRPLKGFELIIRASLYIDDYCFVIAGDGPDKHRLESLVSEYGLESKVLLLGRVSNVHNYIRKFNVMLLTSYSEGFPLTGIEAIWSGVRILYSGISQHKEIFRKVDAELFESGCHDSLIELLKKKNMSEISLHNKGYYKKFLTSNAMYEKYKILYESVS
ncbi:conserved hypothetical protein [Vibrio mimicus VM603]|uniref:Glycosyl transferase family 1 domain-containing protein n=1 Tax=Vibrio mimicus VM603 TaxID=671074 RepID=D2YGE0_VIBMI|nr:conserved hypothetical protein [Vibrio mimicus VM603]